MRGSPNKRLLVYILRVFLRHSWLRLSSGALAVIFRSSMPISRRRRKLDIKTRFFEDFSSILVFESLTISSIWALKLKAIVKGSNTKTELKSSKNRVLRSSFLLRRGIGLLLREITLRSPDTHWCAMAPRKTSKMYTNNLFLERPSRVLERGGV